MSSKRTLRFYVCAYCGDRFGTHYPFRILCDDCRNVFAISVKRAREDYK